MHSPQITSTSSLTPIFTLVQSCSHSKGCFAQILHLQLSTTQFHSGSCKYTPLWVAGILVKSAFCTTAMARLGPAGSDGWMLTILPYTNPLSQSSTSE